METEKVINLLNDSSNEESKFEKWCAIDSQTVKGKYQVFLIILMHLF